MRKFLHGATAVLLLASALIAQNSAAQTVWPSKTVTIVVPVAPGGPLDTVARLMAEEMKAKLSQPIVVENRAGAATQIGSEQVVRAEPDGHTLLVVGASQAILPHLYSDMRYDPAKDIAPVTLIAKGPYGVLVPPSLPVSSISELIALLKKEPGQHNYASAGIGTPPHLAAELFKMQSGVDIVHVPYTGTSRAIPDLISGRVSLFIDALGPSLGLISSGQLKILAVAARERMAILPNVPTMAEQGMPEYESATWIALYAPAATPRPIIDAIHKSVSTALKSEEITAKLRDMAYEIVVSTPEGLRDFQAAESKKNGEIIRRGNIKATQ